MKEVSVSQEIQERQLHQLKAHRCQQWHIKAVFCDKTDKTTRKHTKIFANDEKA